MADPQLKQRLEEKLHEQVTQGFATYSYENAAFYADKLVSLRHAPGNVLLLARAYFFQGDHARSLSVLQRSEFVPKTDAPDARSGGAMCAVDVEDKDVVDCVLLAARCLEAMKEWAKCMQMLNVFDPSIGRANVDPTSHDAVSVLLAATKKMSVFEEHASIASVVYSMAGRCCEEMERRAAAKVYYRLSLQWDSYCWESYYRSVDPHLSTAGDAPGESPLELNFDDANPVDDVVKTLYSCKLSYLQLGPSSLVRTAQPLLFRHTKDSLRMKEEAALEPYFGKRNPYILHCRAERLYYGYHVQPAMHVAYDVLSMDPYHESCCGLYTATLVCMRRKTDLFQLGHEIANRAPNSVLSWFVVGCYYFTVGDYDKAGRYFYKATVANPSFLPAWIAYGHTFHALEEGEHTTAAYRSALRLFPGCHLAALYMGMEHAKSGILPHALSFLEIASSLVTGGTDPLIANETGVAKYKVGMYHEAKSHFWTAIFGDAPAEPAAPGHVAIPEEKNDPFWEPVIFNLAHCFRKLGQYDHALAWYFAALEIRPHNASVLSAIGFTYHLLCDLDNAIHYYHKSLSLKSNDSFSRDMLDRAVAASFRRPIAPVHPPQLATAVAQSPSGVAATPPPAGMMSASTLARRLIDEM